MLVFAVLWVLIGWFFLLVMVKGHGGLTNMFAEGIGEVREKDVELYSTTSAIEKISKTRQISQEVEFQKRVGISPKIIIPCCIIAVIICGFLGPLSFFGLFNIPAGAKVWGLRF